MQRAFIIHGWEGNPDEGWMPWLRAELEKQGWKVESPLMPHRFRPKLNEWLETLSQLVGQPDEQTYFVGHSLGCYTILKYLENLPDETKVGGVVMVAGFAGNLKRSFPILDEYYASGLDWAKVRAHCHNFTAIFSTRDDYVHVQSAAEFERELGAKIIENNEWKHFSGIEGITELPEVLSALVGGRSS